VFTVRYGLVAYIQRIALSVYSAVRTDCLTQQIAFIAYSAVRADCLYTADCVYCLQRGTG